MFALEKRIQDVEKLVRIASNGTQSDKDVEELDVVDIITEVTLAAKRLFNKVLTRPHLRYHISYLGYSPFCKKLYELGNEIWPRDGQFWLLDLEKESKCESCQTPVAVTLTTNRSLFC